MNLEVVDVGARPSVDTLDRNRVQSVANGRIAERVGPLITLRLSKEALVAGRLEYRIRLAPQIVNFYGHFGRDELDAIALLGLQGVAKD